MSDRMTMEEARSALKQLGWKQVDLAERMSALTGNQYSPQTVNAWLTKRGPSDACIIFLKMSLDASGPG